VPILAAFSDETVVARVLVGWEVSGAGPVEGQRAVRWAVTVDNHLADRLFVRLDGLRLVGAAGAVALEGQVACTVGPGRSVMGQGIVHAPAALVDGLRTFAVQPFGLPLGARGRAFYREFRLAQGAEAGAVDAEIAAMAAAPACAP
jgi:hypothetical protein